MQPTAPHIHNTVHLIIKPVVHIGNAAQPAANNLKLLFAAELNKASHAAAKPESLSTNLPASMSPTRAGVFMSGAYPTTAAAGSSATKHRSEKNKGRSSSTPRALPALSNK